jgi:hypothetical protein
VPTNLEHKDDLKRCMALDGVVATLRGAKGDTTCRINRRGTFIPTSLKRVPLMNSIQLSRVKTQSALDTMPSISMRIAASFFPSFSDNILVGSLAMMSMLSMRGCHTRFKKFTKEHIVTLSWLFVLTTGRGSKPAVKVPTKALVTGTTNPSLLKAGKMMRSTNLRVWELLSSFASNQLAHRSVGVRMIPKEHIATSATSIEPKWLRTYIHTYIHTKMATDIHTYIYIHT